MPLRALAFGPLPKSQLQASQRLPLPTGGSPGRPPSVSGVNAPDDMPMVGGGLERVGEDFQPLFPDLFEGGEVANLPEAPDFTSETAQSVASTPPPAASAGSSGPSAGTQAIKASQTALKFGGLGKKFLDVLAAGGMDTSGLSGFSLFGGDSPSDLLAGAKDFSLFAQSPDSVLNPADFSLTAGAGDTAGQAASGASTALTALGPAAAAALIRALPGILSQAGVLTDPEDQSLASLASSIASPGLAAGSAAGGAAIAGTAAGPAAAGAGMLAIPAAVVGGLQAWDAYEDAQKAKQELSQFKTDMGGPIKELSGFVPKDVPGLYDTLSNPASTPEQLGPAYQRAKYLQDLFNAYDQHIKGGGETSIGGKGVFDYTAGLEEGLSPYMQMNEAALLLGQDALTKAGAQFDPFFSSGADSRNPLFTMLGGDSPFLRENYYDYETNKDAQTRQSLAQRGMSAEEIEVAMGLAAGQGNAGLSTRWNPEVQTGINQAFQGKGLLEGLLGVSNQYDVPIHNPFLFAALPRLMQGGG